MGKARSSESGSVLWFILIGVVLIALLTAVLSRSSTSVDQSGDIEQYRIMAGQIMRTAKSYEAAIENMKLRGISESDISFEGGPAGYANTNCTANDCRIFGAAGAGLTYTAPPRGGQSTAADWIFTGANNVGTTAGPVGTTAAGSGNDLLILMPNVREPLCRQINRLLGVNGPDNDPPVDTGTVAVTPFTNAATFPSATLVTLDGDPAPFELDSQNSGCFRNGATGPYMFYHVILER